VPSAETAPATPAGQAPPTSAQPARLVEIRVHGNHATPDEEVQRIVGVALGQPLGPEAADAIEARLRASGKFEDVSVRIRFKTLAEDEAALVVLVREHPGAAPTGTPNPFERTLARVMWLPILDYLDGYGLTYGVRTSLVDAMGRGGRLSVPLSWGGTRQAVLEAEKSFAAGPVDRLFGSFGITSSDNPHYEERDTRTGVFGRAEKALAPLVRVGGQAGWSDVSFGDLDDRLVSYGADLAFDTRNNPAFPRNAVLLRATWRGFRPEVAPTMNQYGAEARGFLGLPRGAVLAGRARYERSDRPAPPYLEFLLGGADTLRGFEAGAFAGDNRLFSSLELRIPFTSPLRIGQAGIDLFFDAGAAYDHGTRLQDVSLPYGGGAGVFLMLPLLQVNLDVARGSQGDWRFHAMTGFRF
jgi:outer membrane protein assembly factor BamA